LALAANDPVLRLQDLLRTDWRIKELLGSLNLAIDDETYLRGNSDPVGTEVPVLFESLMSARDREVHQRRKGRAAALAVIDRALRRRALSRPKWRWVEAGFEDAVTDRHEYLLKGKVLFRAVARVVVWLARLRIAVLNRRRAVAPAEASAQRAELALYSHGTVPWLATTLATVSDGLWDTDVTLDLTAPPTSVEWAFARADGEAKRRADGTDTIAAALKVTLGCATTDAAPITARRSTQLCSRVKAVLDCVAASLSRTAPTCPPLGLLTHWVRLTSDGMYFPPFYMTTPERQCVSLDGTGGSRWMRPLRLRAPNLAADPLLIAKIRPDPPMQAPTALHPAKGWGPTAARRTPVAPAFRYFDEEKASDVAAGKGRRHSAYDLGIMRLRSWAGEDRGILVYGSAAAGDFRRVEAVLAVAVLLRGLIAGLLLDLRPSPIRVSRTRARGESVRALVVHGRTNGRVLASALYYMLARILPGLAPGTFPVSALGGGWAAERAGRIAEAAEVEAKPATPALPASPSDLGLSPSPSYFSLSMVRDRDVQDVHINIGSDMQPPSTPQRTPFTVGSPKATFTFGDGTAADVNTAVKLHERVAIRSDAVLRLDRAPRSSEARPAPFESWLASQVLPPTYFHGEGEPEEEGGQRPPVVPGWSDGRLPNDAGSAAVDAGGWVEREEGHMRIVMAALARLVLTTEKRPPPLRAAASEPEPKLQASERQGVPTQSYSWPRRSSILGEGDFTTASDGHEGPELIDAALMGGRR